jgi:hypothetical protein
MLLAHGPTQHTSLMTNEPNGPIRCRLTNEPNDFYFILFYFLIKKGKMGYQL